ncbi:hypothetical protein GCM10023143_23650 [Compostibacter hankyongensis]|uniref:Uncharacterized protein n=1 Tax=Compostibacter hankyongensis TaxID=1007089 RepID=A0ABP8FY29_9BACT
MFLDLPEKAGGIRFRLLIGAEPDMGVQLIHRTVSFYAKMAFGNAGAAQKTGLAFVTGTGIYFQGHG